MDQNNLATLEKQLGYAGFGESLNGKLKEELQKGSETFSLKYQAEQKVPGTLKENEQPKIDKIDYELNFKKKENGEYALSNFNASLLKHDATKPVEQTFYNYTAKEAYNLLDGRAVNKNLFNKEGEKYNAWTKLDFSQQNEKGQFKMMSFNESYGFDVNKALTDRGVKGLGNSAEYDKKIIDSLKKGNLTPVIFTANGQNIKGFITADPQYKKLIGYDENLKKPYEVKQEKNTTLNNNENKNESVVERTNKKAKEVTR